MAVGPYSSETKWTAKADDYVIRQFEDVYLVYCRPSGMTHILNFLTISILKLITEKPDNFVGLLPRVLADLDVGEEDCPLHLIEMSVVQLDDVGLLHPIVALGGGYE